MRTSPTSSFVPFCNRSDVSLYLTSKPQTNQGFCLHYGLHPGSVDTAKTNKACLELRSASTRAGSSRRPARAIQSSRPSFRFLSVIWISQSSIWLRAILPGDHFQKSRPSQLAISARSSNGPPAPFCVIAIQPITLESNFQAVQTINNPTTSASRVTACHLRIFCNRHSFRYCATTSRARLAHKQVFPAKCRQNQSVLPPLQDRIYGVVLVKWLYS